MDIQRINIADYRTKETALSARHLYTSPYAKKPTCIMLHRNGRWYRVYSQAIGNVACLWIESKGERIYCH